MNQRSKPALALQKPKAMSPEVIFDPERVEDAGK